jgi:hypothetical protein
MKVLARFLTACGCSRDLELDHVPPRYVVPMMPTHHFDRRRDKPGRMPRREFKLWAILNYSDGIMAEYREEVY